MLHRIDVPQRKHFSLPDGNAGRNGLDTRAPLVGAIRVGAIVHNRGVVVGAEIGFVAGVPVEVPHTAFGDVLKKHFHKPVAVVARLRVPEPHRMSDLMRQRADPALIVGADLLLAADHPDGGEAQPFIVFPHEPYIIGLIRPGNQPDGREVRPLENRRVDSLRPWDIGINDIGDHAARPSVTRGRSGIRRLNLIDRKSQEKDYRGQRPRDTNHP